MDFFEYIEETQLPAKSCDSYNGMAFDGCDYYFLLPYQSRVMKYNLCFQKTYSIPTQRKYSGICYDFNCDCFWATSTRYCNKIFKLDKNLEEMDCIIINEYQNEEKVITSISCNKDSNGLLVSFSDQVFELNKITGQCKVLKKTSGEWITGIVSLYWGLMIVSFREDKQYIYIVNGSGKNTRQYCIDNGYVIKDIVASSCNEDTDTVILSMLAAKAGGYSYILKTTISSSDVDNTLCQSIVHDNCMNLDDTNNNNTCSNRIFNGNINKDPAGIPSCCDCCCQCHPCCVDGGIME